jgi:protein-S-isoprenylcysteine O-methyltransferase Ste14
MVKVAAFIAGSIPFLYSSRACLRLPGSHGFYRFFAWESIWGLFLLNVGGWFRNPFSPAQVVSWLLLCVSVFLALHALITLRRFGRSDHSRDDESLIGIEKTTRLVSQGIYRYIRHPLYSSLLWLAWGIFLKSPAWLAGVMGLAATGFVLAAARAEEVENLQFFGPSYREYMNQTKMFIPFLY